MLLSLDPPPFLAYIICEQPLNYKCDYYKSLQPTRDQLFNHITTTIQDAQFVQKFFQHKKGFENIKKLNHHKRTQTYTLERESSWKNYKTKNLNKL